MAKPSSIDMDGDSAWCPLCGGIHAIRTDKGGTPFFMCSTIGYGSCVFFRTIFARERLKEWRKKAGEKTHQVGYKGDIAESPTASPAISTNSVSPLRVSDIIAQTFGRVLPTKKT